jgi:broad specificity phosphatase PhoE
MTGTTIYLVRHGANDVLQNSIAGRAPGISLNEQGRAEAGRAAAFLARKRVQRIVSSPMERARETASPLARLTGLTIETWQEFNEIDFGDWTGRTFAELDPLNSWKRWNAHRSAGTAPNGESMIEVQARVVAGMERLRRDNRGQSVAVFSHGDLIRSAILHYLGMSMDLVLRLQIDPGSISIIELEDWIPRVSALNLLPME